MHCGSSLFIKLFRPTPSQSEVRLEAGIENYDGNHKVDVKGPYL